MYYQTLSTPIGTLFIIEEEEQLTYIFFDEKDFHEHCSKKIILKKETRLLKETVKQLKEYFEQKRKTFDLPIKLQGTDFQVKVWNALSSIPYGQTKSYQDIAIQIGKSKAVRAVGQANKANPLPIVIPCHRVIGKNQKLVGYAGNKVDLKALLLNLEKENIKS